MVLLTEWLRSWRQIAAEIPADRYVSITTDRGDRSYEVLLVSVYDADVDGDRRFIRTGAREFDDKVALFTHLTRDTGAVRIISMRGQPRYVLEPGADTLDWLADVEGVSSAELTQAVREGDLGRKVARLASRGLRRSKARLEAEVQSLREQVEDAEIEADTLRNELKARERDLARRGAE